MKRREFIAKCGAGLAGIIAAGRAPAAVVKSMLGANGIEFVGDASGWKNPYVTDGLVAMWDGEWNIARGKHDPNATVWVDLSGNGYNLATLVSGGWVDRNARFASKSASGITSTIPLNDILTISVCCSNVMLRSSSSERIFISTGYNERKLYLWRDRFICCNKSTYSPAINIRDVNSFTIEFNASTMNSRQQNLGWFGDKPCLSYLLEYVSGSSAFCIGDSYYSMGVFYNVRIYNRYLTQEEITYNWNIDKERFGL